MHPRAAPYILQPFYDEWWKYTGLRDILGHADIKMTMIYAHFSPDHLEDAVTKNPLHSLSWKQP